MYGSWRRRSSGLARCRRGRCLHLGDLPTPLQEFRLQHSKSRNGRSGPMIVGNVSAAHDRGGERSLGGVSLSDRETTPVRIVSIAELEKTAILGTIRQLNGDKLMAARLLGIGKTTLYRKLKEYGITEDD